MKKTRIVVFLQDGLVVDCISDSLSEVEYLIVDSDPNALDKSVATLMEGKHIGFDDDTACLFSVYGDYVFKDTEKVNEIYEIRESRFEGRNRFVS